MPLTPVIDLFFEFERSALPTIPRPPRDEPRRRRPAGSWARSLALALAFGFLLGAPANGAERLAGDEIRRLEAGEILVSTTPVSGHQLPRVRAVGLVGVPPERVWALIDDCASYDRTMPDTLDSEEIERRGNHVRCRAKLDAPFPLPDLESEIEAIHTVEAGHKYRREWKQRTGDFLVNEGKWMVEPYGGGDTTLVTYEALAEPNISVPRFLVDLGIRRTLPGMIEGLRKATAPAARAE